MADTRIKVEKDKVQLIKRLRASDETTGPFQSYADVLAFAAALGKRYRRKEPLKEISKEIDPIRQDIFSSKGYDQLINLLAVVATSEPKVVSSSDTAEEERIKIFEEYANAGFEILEAALRGSVDYLEQVLLILSSERISTTSSKEEFDLSTFL
jgi:dnd system-associated protein 4